VRVVNLSKTCCQVLREEAAALLTVADHVVGFFEATNVLACCDGHIVVTGVGKSGLAAQRFAATLRAGGTPAVFLHPVEAAHGDVGIMASRDALVVFSRSGESDELRDLVSWVRARDVPVVGVTEQFESWLVRHTDACIITGPVAEADPLGLTATTSVTVAGAVADALALALQREQGRTVDDFAALHPGGTLGRRCRVTVADVMVTGDAVGVVEPEEPLFKVMVLLAHKRGTIIVQRAQRLVGVVTAGDLTRYLERRGQGASWEKQPVRLVMNEHPHTTKPDVLAADAIAEMQEAGVMALPVLEGIDLTTHGDPEPVALEQVVGMVHLHDALRARIQ
jgi:arabinose-5-phosphate isomerase